MTFFVSSPSHAVGASCEISDCKIEGPADARQPFIGTAQKSKDGVSITVFTGLAAINASRRLAPQSTYIEEVVLNSPPPRHDDIELRLNDGFLVGGLTELIPNTSIFVTSRHVMQGLHVEAVKNSFASKGLNVDDFQYFGVSNKGELIDLIILVPRSLLTGKLPFGRDLSDLAYEQGERWQRSGDLKHLVGHIWASWQFGSTHVSETFQKSYGQVDRVDPHHRILLSQGPKNFISPGSSGSLVWLAKFSSENSSRDLPWLLGGIVSCVDRTSGTTQVIPMNHLETADLYPIDGPKAMFREPPQINGVCEPVARRKGGGG